MPQITWTADEDRKLTELWAEGLPGTKIGDALGKSKNSIIGRAHRLGLPLRRQSWRIYPKLAERAQSKRKKDIKAKANRPVPPKLWVRKVPPQKPVVFTEPPSLKVPFVHVQTNQCRFIKGDVRLGATFCGHPVEAHMFCQFHHRLCYRSPDARSKQWSRSIT